MTGRDRNQNGTFKPGNRAGTGTKRRVPRTVLKQAISDKDISNLLQKGLAKALAGDDSWSQFLLNKVIPGVKSVSPPIQVDLDFTTLETTLQTILERCAEGQISTDQAKDLIHAAQGVGTIQKLSDIQDRLEQLEAQRARLSAV